MGVYQRGESWYIDFYEDGKRYTERVGPVSKSRRKVLNPKIRGYPGRMEAQKDPGPF